MAAHDVRSGPPRPCHREPRATRLYREIRARHQPGTRVWPTGIGLWGVLLAGWLVSDLPAQQSIGDPTEIATAVLNDHLARMDAISSGVWTVDGTKDIKSGSVPGVGSETLKGYFDRSGRRFRFDRNEDTLRPMRIAADGTEYGVMVRYLRVGERRHVADPMQQFVQRYRPDEELLATVRPIDVRFACLLTPSHLDRELESDRVKEQVGLGLKHVVKVVEDLGTVRIRYYYPDTMIGTELRFSGEPLCPVHRRVFRELSDGDELLLAQSEAEWRKVGQHTVPVSYRTKSRLFRRDASRPLYNTRSWTIAWHAIDRPVPDHHFRVEELVDSPFGAVMQRDPGGGRSRRVDAFGETGAVPKPDPPAGNDSAQRRRAAGPQPWWKPTVSHVSVLSLVALH